MSNTPAQQNLADNTLSHEEQQIIRDFSELLEARMVSGASKGFSDWQDTVKFPDNKLRIMLVKALREADWGSVAAYAMMAQHRGLKVVDVNGNYGLPRSVLVGEELDRDFVHIWTRTDHPVSQMGGDLPGDTKQKPVPPVGTIRTEGFLSSKSVRDDFEGRD